jgi:hypothetical protein
MVTSSVEVENETPEPEQRLWTAVIARTVEEWVSGPKRLQQLAEDFLFNNEDDFKTVCASAGLDPARFRGKLAKLKSQRLAVQHGSVN